MGGVVRVMAAACAVSVLTACSSSTDPDVKPTRADITVTGSSTVPLQLVVSTDFVELFDQVNQERQVSLTTADTITIETLPYDSRVQLTDLGKIYVDLSNPSDIEATVRLRVEVDSGQDPYDRQAIMSEGGALRFVFSFFEPGF